MPKRWFLAWVVLGVGYTFVVLGALTIGVFLLPLVAGATWFVATRPGASEGAIGVVSGLGLPLLFLAYMNRQGPGTVCTSTGGGQHCTEQWSPWPWLGVGGALLLLGAFQFRLQQARRP